MLFNSIDFAVFLPLVFLLYWFVFNKSLKTQNLFLLVVSYIFYGWWDWRFTFLIAFSTIIDYFMSIKIAGSKSTQSRKTFLLISLCVNIGLLGFFKYYNFFVDSFTEAFTFMGMNFSVNHLHIILPVGISFYTFQTLSYTIDVYKGKLNHTKEFIPFAAFISFFPQLVAGPIERATNLLPQFQKHRTFSYAQGVAGLRQILWGLFKKVVIADNCATLVNDIFHNYENLDSPTLILGAFLFSFQIYGDFSGYSDIAIGTSRLFGFTLMRNFRYPYFSRNIAEFWRRWHISLSTWFRDYLYIPLGGSQVSKIKKIRNTFIIFLVSGFWHGANWTFLFWGLIHAILFIPLLLLNKNRNYTGPIAQNKKLPSLKEFLNIGLTFVAVMLTWVFFRSESIHQALNYLWRLLTKLNFNKIEVNNQYTLLISLLFISLMVVIEWWQRDRQHGFDFNEKSTRKTTRFSLYTIACLCIIWFGGAQAEFIYFQF